MMLTRNNLVEEAVERTKAHIRRAMYVGRDSHNGRLRYLESKDYLLTHMYLLAPPRYGKSYMIEHLLREFTDLWVPGTIVDPHGDHAEGYHDFLLRIPRLRRGRRVIYFKPGSSANAVGLNPFDCGLRHPADVASLVLEAFMKVWGTETLNDTPRLERILRNMFYLFAASQVPLTEAYRFLTVENRPFRESLIAAAPDERVRQNCQEVERFPLLEKMNRFESSWNRLQRFIELPGVQQMFTPQPKNLNFAHILNRGDILVANLSRLYSTEAQSLVGTMLVNALYHAAKRRPEERRQVRVVAIDEFPQFVTTDIARSLDQFGKFGVRLMLAHQHLDQLPEQLASSVMVGAKIKFIFGGGQRRDTEILSRELFTGVPRGDRIKHQSFQTKFRPRLEERTIETNSESDTEGDGQSDGMSEGATSGGGSSFGDSHSQRMTESGPDETHSNSATSTSSFQAQRGTSRSRSYSRSTTAGHSRSTAFVTEHDEFQEEGGRQYWSLDEQWEELVTHMVNLDRREVLVKVFNQPVMQVTTPDVEHRPRRRRRMPRKPRRLAKARISATAQSLEDGDGLPEDFHE